MQNTVRALKSQVHRQSLYTLAKGVSSFPGRRLCGQLPAVPAMGLPRGLVPPGLAGEAGSGRLWGGAGFHHSKERPL